MSRRALTLAELVAVYVSELAHARRERRPDRVWSTDLALYNGGFKMWFDDAMLFWANYIADQVSRGPLTPPLDRAVIRYVPLKMPDWRSISEAQEYWLRMRVGMHWLLSPGPTNLVTFGTLDSRSMQLLNYAVIPNVLLVESPGLFNREFDTRVVRGTSADVTDRGEFMESLSEMETLEHQEVHDQEVFPIFYRADTFRAQRRDNRPQRQEKGYLRDVLGRFLWKLQQGICPACGIEVRYRFHEMEVDHIVPLTRGGNSTLLNTEMKCREHNSWKNRRLSETRDYVQVIAQMTALANSKRAWLQPFFTMVESNVEFPVRFSIESA